MKIAFFADGPWSHLSIEKICNNKNFKIAFICGRYSHCDDYLKQKAKLLSVPFIQHKNIKEDDFKKKIKNFNYDIIVSMSFDQIFDIDLILSARNGAINCHAGKLPLYRGRNVLNWALINDEKEIGVTVHYMDEKIDNGDIILQRSIPVTDSDNYKTILDKSHYLCADILYDSLLRIKSGNVKRIKQSSTGLQPMYCVKRKEGDESINWNTSSREIFNFVRALSSPGPIARTKINEIEFKIKKIKYIENAPIYIGIPGSIIRKDNFHFLVKTLDSYVDIIDWESSVSPKVGDRFA
jgi:methionyl-tRNA formyltransferase